MVHPRIVTLSQTYKKSRHAIVCATAFAKLRAQSPAVRTDWGGLGSDPGAYDPNVAKAISRSRTGADVEAIVLGRV